jgi:hypothetical protein
VWSFLIAAGLAVWAAAAMTLGDWIWAVLALRHRPQYGLAHGTLLCLWLGLYIGLASGRVVGGLMRGAGVGFLAAGSFYSLAPLMGYSAMFVSWMLVWFGLAIVVATLLTDRWTSRRRSRSIPSRGSGCGLFGRPITPGTSSHGRSPSCQARSRC